MIEDINGLFESVSAITGAGICFYDLGTGYSYNRKGDHDYVGHYCEYCKCMHLLNGGREACIKNDRYEVINLANEYNEPFFNECYAGIYELILPIRIKAELKGVIFVGQCRIEENDGSEKVYTIAEKMGGSGKEFLDMYNALPVLTKEKMISAGRIITSYLDKIQGLSELFTENKYEKVRADVITIMQNYVKTNYMKGITASSVANRVFLDKSYAARLFKRKTEMTITEYINKTRIKYALRLIENSNIPLNSIAINVGFTDPNYFTRVFRKVMGHNPSEHPRPTVKRKTDIG